MGVSVKEINSETTVMMNIVIASGPMNRPIRVCIIVRGNSTTTFVLALATTAMNASLAPNRAASRGSPQASSRSTIASKTTIELVTRMPVDMPMAINVEMFSV